MITAEEKYKYQTDPVFRRVSKMIVDLIVKFRFTKNDNR